MIKSLSFVLAFLFCGNLFAEEDVHLDISDAQIAAACVYPFPAQCQKGTKLYEGNRKLQNKSKINPIEWRYFLDCKDDTSFTFIIFLMEDQQYAMEKYCCNQADMKVVSNKKGEKKYVSACFPDYYKDYRKDQKWIDFMHTTMLKFGLREGKEDKGVLTPRQPDPESRTLQSVKSTKSK